MRKLRSLLGRAVWAVGSFLAPRLLRRWRQRRAIDNAKAG